MGYRVVLRRSASRDLVDLPHLVRGRVSRAVGALADDPRPRGARLLAGADRIWRIRVGDYRILYRIDGEEVRVLVIRILHRSKAYRS